MHARAAAPLERLTDLHNSIKHVVRALPAAALDWSQAPEVNSVAVRVTHIRGSEHFWIGEKANFDPS